MQIPKNSNKHKNLNRALIIMIPIMITIAVFLILNNAEIQISKQKGPKIKASYSSIENNTWDISENGDRSVVATLSKDGVLSISGTGKMKNWSHSENAYWYEMIDKITSVIIDEGVTNIGDFAFNGCTSLTNIIIPNSVTSIGHIAFYECTSLTELKIPNNVTSIGDSAFNRCTSLTNIVIPNSVTSIGNSAFMECTSLSNIVISDNVTSIKPFSFLECTSLTSIEIPNSVNNIERFAFSYCSKLRSIKISNGVTNIDDGVFMSCTGLTTIDIPNSVTSIGECAFLGCTSLTNVKIPDSVTSVETQAFERCTSLTSIEIPHSVTSIGRCVFDGCASLTSIKVDKDNKHYMDDNGVLYTKDSSKIIRYPEGKQETKYTILSYVTSIEHGAFKRCASLNSIKIPNSVTNIGQSAFEGCTGITSMEIPNSVTNIEGNAFWKCPSLTNIIIPNSVTSIGICVFLGCPSLTIYCPSNSYAKQYAINNNIKYVIDDVAPITSVIGNTTQWTNKDVTLTISAEDSLVGLAEEPYSFDGGKTWQAENRKTYTSNSAGIIIKVRDKLGNIYTHDVIHVLKIDKYAPKITNVTGNPIQWTNKNVTLRILAGDSFSGLAEKPYSFDGGKTWQSENTKTYAKNTSKILIQVKDKAGNITTYNQTINIKKIDKTVPLITSVTSKSTSWKSKNVTLTINAFDSLSGLAEKAYSFDGGKTWQTENTKTYTKNPVGIIIKVKDKAGNIATYSTIKKLPKLELY